MRLKLMWIKTQYYFVSIHVIFNQKEEPGLCKNMIMCGFKVSNSVCGSKAIMAKVTINNYETHARVQIDKLNV